MTLKLIPVESRNENRKKQKHFNPGNKMKKKMPQEMGILKNICLRLVHFVNRGGKYTYNQIDELIMSLQRTILSLQRQKHEILKKQKK